LRHVLAIDDATAQSADTWAGCLDAALAAGFEAIDVPAGAGPDRISQASQRGLRPVVVRWRDGLIGPRTRKTDGWPEPATENLASSLGWIADAGGAIATVRPAHNAAGGQDAEVASYADALWRTHEALIALRLPMESSGVSVGVEAAADGFLLSPVELRDLLDRINSPCFAACLNLADVARIGRPLDWIGTLRHRIGCVRLGGESEAELNDIAAALREVLYAGPVVCGGEPNEATRMLERFPVRAAH